METPRFLVEFATMSATVILAWVAVRGQLRKEKIMEAAVRPKTNPQDITNNALHQKSAFSSVMYWSALGLMSASLGMLFMMSYWPDGGAPLSSGGAASIVRAVFGLWLSFYCMRL